MTDQNTQFFAILTAVGEAKLANATALGTSLVLSQMGVGDANGTEPIPSRTQTKLINERRRAPLNQVKVDPTNTSVIIAEQIIPESVGGWWVRELALYDADGDLVAVANCAPTYKSLLAQGSGRTQVIRINLIVSSSANIELKIDPSVVLATREYVDTVVIDAMAKLDFKHSVLVATTANTVLSGSQTVDGVLVVEGARVLVKDQTQAKDNGIYVLPAAGAWKRAQDADSNAEVTPGLFVSVEKGTVNGDSVWQLVTDAPIVLGTTALTFEMVAGRTGIIAGTYGVLTVDKYGRVVGGTNPSTLSGHGITDGMSSTPQAVLAGKIADITKHAVGTYGAGTTDAPSALSSGGMFLRLKSPGSALAFDIFGHVGGGSDVFGFRQVLADGSSTWRKVWHDGNFDPALKANLAGATFTGPVNVLNLAAGANDQRAANTAFVQAAIAALVATALGNDASFATTVTNALALKAPLASPALTGAPTAPTAALGAANQLLANTAFVANAINALFTDPWAFQPIGVPIPVMFGAGEPPTNKSYRYIKLTAAESYNTGVLTGEVVTGVAPMVVAYARVSLAGSPINGNTVYLINTERRSIRPGLGGTLQDDAIQNITGKLAAGLPTFGGVAAEGVFAYTPVSGSSQTGVTGTGGTVNGLIDLTFDASRVARTSNETRLKNIGANYYMRVL